MKIILHHLKTALFKHQYQLYYNAIIIVVESQLISSRFIITALDQKPYSFFKLNLSFGLDYVFKTLFHFEPGMGLNCRPFYNTVTDNLTTPILKTPTFHKNQRPSIVKTCCKIIKNNYSNLWQAVWGLLQNIR